MGEDVEEGKRAAGREGREEAGGRPIEREEVEKIEAGTEDAGRGESGAAGIGDAGMDVP